MAEKNQQQRSSWKLLSLTVFTVGLLTVAVTVSCSPQGGGSPPSDQNTENGRDVPDKPGQGNVVAPLWEEARDDGEHWTQIANSLIEKYGRNLLRGSLDIERFCPQYYSFTHSQKVNFWSYFISAVVKYESEFEPTLRYVETTMGVDEITGEHVTSEGLLQLSYQDVLFNPYCNEFDWNTDKNLSRTDPHKTIFDVEKNLRCGIRIMNQQVSKKNALAFNQGNYWSTLMPSHEHSAVASIQKLTLSMATCNPQNATPTATPAESPSASPSASPSPAKPIVH